AGYFQINGKDVIVPMVVEEPSIVAAASFMAKLARVGGGFHTSSTGPLMRAQVQVVGVSDPHGARLAILQRKNELIGLANSR
ncbi:3-hydroxy-3-methylglutaryl-CoA reductase, partial [Paraburkholderia sp. SIMBA_049]